jgi:hypothetical protein
LKSERKAGIGYGNKCNEIDKELDDFTTLCAATPGPNVYEKKGFFVDNLEKKHGWSFGLSREV